MTRFPEILICAALLSAGASVSYAQQDTILVRPVSISIESGNIDIQADTVVFENVTVPKDNVTVPRDMVSEADALRGAYRFEDALSIYKAAASGDLTQRWLPQHSSPPSPPATPISQMRKLRLKEVTYHRKHISS